MGAKLSVEIVGVKKLLGQLKARIGDYIQALEAAMWMEAENIMSDSRPLVPKDTGMLVNSGHVELPIRTSEGIEVAFGYGGASAGYATYVHENLEAHHTVGQAKYLEIPVQKAKPGMSARIAARMQRRLSKPR